MPKRKASASPSPPPTIWRHLGLTSPPQAAYLWDTPEGREAYDRWGASNSLHTAAAPLPPPAPPCALDTIPVEIFWDILALLPPVSVIALQLTSRSINGMTLGEKGEVPNAVGELDLDDTAEDRAMYYKIMHESELNGLGRALPNYLLCRHCGLFKDNSPLGFVDGAFNRQHTQRCCIACFWENCRPTNGNLVARQTISGRPLFLCFMCWSPQFVDNKATNANLDEMRRKNLRSSSRKWVRTVAWQRWLQEADTKEICKTCVREMPPMQRRRGLTKALTPDQVRLLRIRTVEREMDVNFSLYE